MGQENASRVRGPCGDIFVDGINLRAINRARDRQACSNSVQRARMAFGQKARQSFFCGNVGDVIDFANPAFWRPLRGGHNRVNFRTPSHHSLQRLISVPRPKMLSPTDEFLGFLRIVTALCSAYL